MNFTLELEKINNQGLMRTLSLVDTCDLPWIKWEGKNLYNLSSNDYLGLAQDKNLWEEFTNVWLNNSQLNMGAASSRLMTGNHFFYDETEKLLEELYGRPALFFNSGYHANTGILKAVTSKTDLIISDKLVHASLIDGIHLSAATHFRYNHNNYDHLEKILIQKRHLFKETIIVTESIFSMDGDCADLKKLVELKSKYNLTLYVDEAHAIGALGENGLGLCEVNNVLNEIDFIVCPMGKAMGSVGAFVITNPSTHKWLINKARTLIYSTALPPINMAWNYLIITKLKQFNPRRVHLNNISIYFKNQLSILNYTTNSNSHIIPIIIVENNHTCMLSHDLKNEGFYTTAVRPPTVPEGTSRIRISLNSTMSTNELDIFFNIFTSTLAKIKIL